MKQGEKITIEQVLKSRGNISGASTLHDKIANTKVNDKAPFDYNKKTESSMRSTKGFSRKIHSKERELNNQSYVGVDKRRLPSSLKEEVKQMHNTSYVLPNVESRRSKLRYEHEDKRYLDIEPYSDPNSRFDNSHILNVVSPLDKSGFHITDLLDQKRSTQKFSERQEAGNKSMFEGISPLEDKYSTAVPQYRPSKAENRYMIKNFRVVNLSELDSKKASKAIKPITAAPMLHNDFQAREIKKIASGASSRKARFNSTTNVSRGQKSPVKLPVSNSLLSPDEKGQYTNMKPISNLFSQLYEETDYMFPKHKSKFGVQTSYTFGFKPRPKSLSRTQRVESAEESKAETQNSEDKFKRRDLSSRAELEYLLQKSLKYHKEKQSKKGTPVASLTDDDKLEIIMKTWLTDNPNDPAYLLDNIESEAQMTSHMIVNTQNNKSIYPEEIKDAEIDIYLRNRKHIPKYELLQYMKFSGPSETELKTKASSSPKDDSNNHKDDSSPNEEDFDLSVGCVNPLTNSRLLLSFKLN